MSEWTVEKFTHRVSELQLVDRRELERALGSAPSEAGVDDIVKILVGRQLLTNLQVDRIFRGERTGFFYGKWMAQYLIGTGSFARVYRAVNRETGEVRAVKVLRKRYRESLADMEQFLREGRMGSQLHHMNIVPIFEIEGDPRAPFLVMEFVEGENLRDLIRVRKKFDCKTTVSIITDVAAGLAFAAERGITHRDMKMSNVLLTSGGRAKLVDFGLAAARNVKDDKELADCPNARAIDYAALERGTGVRKDDIRSDIFFTGCIMYHCLTGTPALFETKDRIQRLNYGRFRDITPILKLEPELPLSVVQFVNKALELDVTKRFQSPAELLHEARHLAQRLEAGEDDRADAETVEAAAAATPRAPAQREGEGANRTVLVVESQIEMQDALRDSLKKRGYRVLIMRNPDTVFERFADDPKVADCVVFCTTELKERAIDAFNRFGAEEVTEDVPAILIANSKSAASAAETAPHRALLPLPLKIRDLRLTLHKLCSARAEVS